MNNRLALIAFNNHHYNKKATDLHIGPNSSWSVKFDSTWYGGFTFADNVNRSVREAIARSN